jgi:hypothetical protein
MARVPITVMGFRCERCSHEWIPRGVVEEEPRVCPKCRSPWWNRPKKAMMTYDDFKEKIAATLKTAGRPLTWTEIRTTASLPQAFPNNQWVHKMERDIGLVRRKEPDGIIHWALKDSAVAQGENAPAKTPNKARPRPRGQQGVVE